MLKKLLTLAVVPVILLAWAHFGATPLVMGTFNRFLGYQSPYLAQLPAGDPSTPLAGQVVLVIVDGLRDDVSRQMPVVNALRGQGASRTLRTGLPSLSVPCAVTIATGTWPEQNGVTTNWYEGVVGVDSIFARARAAGLTTAVAGPAEWSALFPGQFDGTTVVKWQTEASDDAVIDGALGLLKDRAPDLLLVHLSSPDESAHASGGASAEYRRVSLDTDARIARLLAAVNLKNAAFIVTADHGQIDTGGHGGWEPVVTDVPFVAAGPGITPGVYPRGEQADLAPTLAALLGSAFPANSRGSPLWDMLELPEELRARRAVEAGIQLSAAYQAYARQIGTQLSYEPALVSARAALDRRDWAAAYRDAIGLEAGLEAQAAAAREARLWRERLGRVPIVLLLLVPFAAWLYLARRQRWGLVLPLLGALAYFLMYNALFFGRGNSYSFSVFNSEDQIEAYFTQRGVEALLALLVAGLLVAVLAARRRDWFRSALAAVNCMFLVALGLALQILFFYWLWDIRFSWYIPDTALGFKYWTDVIQTTAFYPLVYLPVAALLPALAAAIAWALRRFSTERVRPDRVVTSHS